MTINLENRRELDFSLIKSAAKRRPRTFTELLHITKLPRKTLSLRLKDLCTDAALVKENGVYKLNGSGEFENNGGKFTKGFTRALSDRRMRKGLMLIALLGFSSMSGYVLAMHLTRPQPAQTYQGPVMIGNFTMALDVNNIEDLYGWEVAITFNSSELKFLKFMSGGFVGTGFPFSFNASDIGEGVVLLGGTLCGNVYGKDGSGRLATVVFGYFVDQYTEPKIDFEDKCFETVLYDSTRSHIPIEDSTLTLTVIKNY